jgi:hypothetical protein
MMHGLAKPLVQPDQSAFTRPEGGFRDTSVDPLRAAFRIDAFRAILCGLAATVVCARLVRRPHQWDSTTPHEDEQRKQWPLAG